MFITPDRIARLAPRVRVETATHLAKALSDAMPAFGVVTLLDRAHFMAEACHETAGFTRFEENLNYRDAKRLDAMFSAVRGEADAAVLIAQGPQAIANRVYARRNGNGSEGSGDGWLYRGRGLFHLTGRSNYANAEAGLRRPYLTSPDLVALPHGAVLTALWFWKQNQCGRRAAADDVEGVTRIINGPGMAGLADRRDLTMKAKHIFT